MQEVSRSHSTKGRPSRRNPRLKDPFGKDQIQRKPLNPHYVAGFIDGEGSFCVSLGKHRTLKSGIEVRPEFEIELRADDQEILERIVVTIGCGIIYDLSYDRYGWYPHVKLKVGSRRDMEQFLFPFLDKYPLQAKKAQVYTLFKEIVLMACRKEHLTPEGLEKIQHLRNEMRKFGKKHNFKKNFDASLETARIRENRSSSGVGTTK